MAGVLAVWLALAAGGSAQNAASVAPVPGAAGVSAAPDVPVAAVTRLGNISDLAGRQVSDIELRGMGDDASVHKYLRGLILQQVNEPLDRGKVRQSLHALYATGRFSDLQVQAEPGSQNDVRLIFNARANYFVGGVTVDGNPKRPSANQLVTATKLQLGEVYTPENVDAALAGMRAVLMENGFYLAEITHTEDFHADTQQVDIHFHVAPDGRAHIGQITILGSPGYTPDEIEDIAHFSSGHTVTAPRVTKALQKLRKKYQKKGRLQAQVAITDRGFHPDSNTLDYVFRIDQGPTVDVRVDGANIGASKLKKLVPIYEEGSVDDDLLNEGTRNLRDYLETKGYFDARVTWTKEYEQAANRVHVIFHVDQGIKHKLDGIAIRFIDTVTLGRPYFDTATILERMQVRPERFMLPQGIYSESLLARDIQAIEALYKTNGFEHVRVEREVEDDYHQVKGHMMIRLLISEGPQVRVGSLKLVGNQSFPDETLEALMNTNPGQPFSEVNVGTDREAVLSFYFNNGFPDAQFESTANAAPGAPNLMNVVFTITEGRRVFVDRVLVSGLNYTRPYVVNRELQVHTGDAMNRMGMLDTQKKLYDLGIFNEVDMAVQNPGGEAAYKSLLLQMSEAKRWMFNYGFGFEVQTGGQPADIGQVNTAPAPGVHVPPNTIPWNNGVPIGTNPQGGTGFTPSVTFEVTRINFQGRDHTVGLKTRLSNLQKRALLSYDAPHWFNSEDFRLNFTALYDNSRDVRTFSSERMEGSVQMEQALTRTASGLAVSTLLYRYSYRRVKVDPRSLAISSSLVPLLSKPVLLGMPGLTYIRDKRNNPLDSTKGNYTTFDFGVSARVFGSGSVTDTTGVEPQTTAANFLRLLAQNSTYTPIPWAKGIIFARSTRIGVEDPFGHNAGTAEIPLPERFYAGGAATHRGFALNQAGPRDLTTGFPLGGNALFVNSMELRFPPPILPFVGTNLSFVLFHDFGNVFQSAQEMVHSFGRWQQPNRSACDSEATRLHCRFDYMSQALGTGIRYKTPLGPVRLDLSYNLNPPSFPFFVQCPPHTWPNEPWPCSALPVNGQWFQHATLRHFNFFFSIGQSF